jgi:hypothetical protein
VALVLEIVGDARGLGYRAQSTLIVKHRCVDEFVSTVYELDGAASNSVNAPLVWKYEHFSIFRIPPFASGDDNHIILQHIFRS